MSALDKAKKRAREKLERQQAARAARADVRAARAARASVADGAAVLAPVPVTVSLLCPRCSSVLVSMTVNGRDVGAPFCRSCDEP